MSRVRDEILEWAEQGRVAPGRLRAALDACGALPNAARWRDFLDRQMLWGGALCLAAAAIFFVAYNWSRLGRFGKIALAEAVVIAALWFVGRLGLERAAGRAALLVASLVVGALLALIGQTYQTGADTFELFAWWALAILPWVLLGRFAALWLVWIAIVQLALALYYQAFGGWFGLMFPLDRPLWLHLALNTALLVAWERAAAAGIMWLRERWALRVLATTGGVFATALALYATFGTSSGFGMGQLGWLAWLALTYYLYRHRARDVFVLAGAVLSVVIVAAAIPSRHLRLSGPEVSLFLGVIVIAVSGLGGWWLREVTREDAA